MFTHSLRSSLSGFLGFFMLIIFFSLATGCRPDEERVDPVVVEDPLSNRPDVTTTLTGIVLDEDGEPLSGVKVTVEGATTTTNAEGSFRLQEISVPGNRCVIRCEKEGYFTSVRAEVPLKDGQTATRIRLMSSAPTHTIDAEAGGVATLGNGSKVEIPAEGLVTESGSPYAGQVNMSVRYMDPTAISFGAFVAGGDMLARRTDESTSILYSYGILRVLLSGSEGEKLQLAAGKTSTLTMAIPASQLTTAPATIPLWYFDEEAGVWIEEGAAVRQGNHYIGTVAHFTDWNCDDPKEYATVKGRVVDCNGGFIMHGEVFVGQSTSDLSNGVVIDNGFPGEGGAQAGFNMRVPAGMPLMVVVPPPLIPVLSTTEATNWVLVPVPPLAPGQVYDVGDIKPHPCPSVASGSVKLKTGDQLASITMQTNSGSSSNLYGGHMPVTISGTAFSANFLAANTSYTLRVVTTAGLVLTKAFQTTGTGETVDLGVIDLTSEQQITVEGVVLCTNTPLANASVKVVWSGGSANITTNSLGLYSFSMPVNTAATVTASHSSKTASLNFVTPASGGFRIDNLDVCNNNIQTGENSFVINGGGYNNATKVLSLSAYPSSFGFYHRDEAVSQLVLTDAQDVLNVSLIFPGNAAGTVSNNDLTGIVIGIKTGNSTMNYWAGFSVEGTDLTINVTRYDAVDGLIEGTFSGTFINDNGASVRITSGKFSVIRYYDFSGEECNGFCM